MNKLLHLSTAIYLALIMLVKMMAMPISLAEYSLNKNAIAENLCENKARSEMHCAGKCFLSKKLVKSNDSQDAQNTKGGTKITMADYCETFDCLSFNVNTVTLRHMNSFRAANIPTGNLTSVLRPPIA